MKNKAAKIEKTKGVRGSFGRTRTLIKLALLGVVVVMTLSAAVHIMDNIADLQAEHEIVQTQIKEANARRQEIEDSAAYTESIEFIEYVARNMLNLVRRDEIIFIMTTE